MGGYCSDSRRNAQAQSKLIFHITGWRKPLSAPGPHPHLHFSHRTQVTPIGRSTMKTIQVYDPPMCCSTGICGTDINPDLVSFAAMLAQLSTQGVKVERFNLGQQPMAFVQNAAVKALLDKEGAEALPLIFIEGEVYLKGRYPTGAERPVFFQAAVGEETKVVS